MNVLVNEGFFINQRGLRIHYQTWENDGVIPKRIATIIHGLGEHIGRYNDFSSYLTTLQFKVYGSDLYGFGKSQGKRGDVFRVKDYQIDEKKLFSIIEEREKEKLSINRLLIGQSLGAVIALAYLQIYPEDYTHAIILSPSLNPERNVSRGLMFIGKIVRIFYPSFPFDNKIKADQLTDDGEVQKIYREDPLVHHKISPRLFLELLDLCDRVKKNKDKFRRDLKVLFIHGEDDEVTYHGDTESYYNNLPLKDKSISVIPDMKHETLRDPEKEKVYYTITEWVNKNF